MTENMAGVAPADLRTMVLQEYVLEFADNEAPKFHRFSAISDEHAVQMMKQQFRGYSSTLYRLAGDERHEVYVFGK